jgi:hypothetical protein
LQPTHRAWCALFGVEPDSGDDATVNPPPLPEPDCPRAGVSLHAHVGDARPARRLPARYKVLPEPFVFSDWDC